MIASRLLRIALLADAAATGATAVLLLLFAAPFETLLGLPAGLSRIAGLGLIPYAALVAYLGTRPRMSRAAVWTVIVCNVAWAVDSILLLFIGPVQPASLGAAFVVAQAVIVAVFADLQYLGLRRPSALTAPA